MKHYISLIFIVLLVMVSCRTTKEISSQPVVITNADSVRVETITITRLDTVTICVSIPEQTVERVTFNSKSHLETDFAESDAWINDDGSLFHNIKNKPQSHASDAIVPITIQETNTENVSYKEIPIYVPTKVEVERDFTAWEQFRLKAFWYLVLVSLAGIGWIFRKQLISSIKKLC